MACVAYKPLLKKGAARGPREKSVVVLIIVKIIIIVIKGIIVILCQKFVHIYSSNAGKAIGWC